MRAAFLVEPRRIEVRDVPRPKPGPGEVLVRVRACGICGSDVHYYLDGRIGDTVATEPLILGHEFAGEVAELGDGVTGLCIGQPVAVEPAISCGTCEMCLEGHPNLCHHIRFMSTPPDQGGLAEYIITAPHRCFPLPETLTAADGAMLEPLGVALHTVKLARLFVGDTAAVVGCGPIGLLTLQLAKASGAIAVVATDRVPYRLDFARRYGATLTVNVTDEDPAVAVSRYTGGRGVDRVFEAAGAAESPEQAVQLVRNGGTVMLIGIPTANVLSVTANTTRRKGLTLKAVRRMKHTYPRAIALTAAGMVDVRGLVTHRFPLEQANEAFDLVAHLGDGVIKAMIEL
ncbi:MAG: NAD(P)-dependent alcohol dehydrogenase [Anaerolineae bacterium]